MIISILEHQRVVLLHICDVCSIQMSGESVQGETTPEPGELIAHAG
jgi:hypothetical protein